MRRRWFKEADMAAIVARVRQLRAQGIGTMESCEAAGLEFGREPQSVYHLMRRLEPTTDIASAYIKSSALRLAVRVVRDANVPEAIDILSRKDMNVLAPRTEEHAGQGGFFLSVQAESCGAVKIGVASAQGSLAGAQRQAESEGEEGEREARPLESRVSLLGAPSEEAANAVIDVRKVLRPRKPVNQKSESEHGRQGHIQTVITDRQRKAIEAAKQRLKTAQRKRRRQHRLGRFAQEATTQPDQESSEDVDRTV